MPWDDLRYVFGEIMYGGHIVEDWDRRLATAYLLKYFNENLLEGMEMFPGFVTPANSLSHKQVRRGSCPEWFLPVLSGDRAAGWDLASGAARLPLEPV